jgi:hypothetical protein
MRNWSNTWGEASINGGKRETVRIIAMGPIFATF